MVIDALNVEFVADYVTLPWRVCIWTAAPNDRLDVDPGNDYACLDFGSPVSTGEPGRTESIGVFPNPATDQVRFVLPATSGALVRCRLFSASGQLLRDHEAPEGTVEFYENVGDVPPGIYLVEIGGLFGRLAKL